MFPGLAKAIQLSNLCRGIASQDPCRMASRADRSTQCPPTPEESAIIKVRALMGLPSSFKDAPISDTTKLPPLLWCYHCELFVTAVKGIMHGNKKGYLRGRTWTSRDDPRPLSQSQSPPMSRGLAGIPRYIPPAQPVVQHV